MKKITIIIALLLTTTAYSKSIELPNNFGNSNYSQFCISTGNDGTDKTGNDGTDKTGNDGTDKTGNDGTDKTGNDGTDSFIYCQIIHSSDIK